MSKPVKTILQYAFFLALGAFFVWLSIRNITQEHWVVIRDSILRARYWLIIPAFILLILSHYSRAMRWKLLMEPLGYKPSNFNTFAAVMIGYLVNAGAPRLGEVVKCTLLAKYEKVRADRLVGTIVMERAVDVVSLLIVFLLTLALQWQVIGSHVSQGISSFVQDNTGKASLTRIIIIVSAIAAAIPVFYFVLKRFGHIDAVARIREILTGIFHGLTSIRLVKKKGLFLFHSAFIWLLYLASTTLGVYALKETAHLGIAGGLTTLAVGSIGMVLTPGGIGAYPLLVAGLMGWYGIDQQTIGNALGWLLWSVQTLIVIFGGVICFALFTFFNKNRTKIEIPHPITEQDPVRI